MPITRRDLAAAGALVLGTATLAAPRTADAAADEEAVTKAVEAMRKAVFDKNKQDLDKLTAAQLSYGHSSAVVQNKAEFIDGVVGRKATIKSLSYPELKVTMAGNNAIARHRYVAESEQDGKTTNTDIGILEVWAKDGADWKLLARQGYKLPTA